MPRIFFVDYDDSIKERLGNALCPHEFDVTTFRSPLEALAGISSGVPDLLVSGIRLPDMNGFDLADAAREIETDLPVIFITDKPSETDKSRAKKSGVKHVLARPENDFGELVDAIRSELSWSCARDAVRELDEIRMEFFTDLSHKLRTPITAMKLAIEGLFLQLRGAPDPSQRGLADVNRRNIERVVQLVENQLDLLQFMMGESRINRRLFDVNELISDIPRRLFGGEQSTGGEPVEIRSSRTAGGPMYVFTDPAPLATIIDCLLGGGPSNIKKVLSVAYDPAGKNCQIDVELDFLNADCCSGEHARAGQGPSGRCAMNRFDFEYRAYKSLLAQLGGEVSLEKSANNKRVRIILPRYPDYDRDKDFINPIRVMQTAAEEKGYNVTLLRYDLGGGFEGDYLDAAEDQPRGLLTRLEAVVSEGDCVLRGKRPNTIYLALTERSPSELDNIMSRLNEYPSPGRGNSDSYASEPQTVVEDYCRIIELTRDLEPV
jgi:DNA-binding response OmpR family regulator